MKTIYTLVLLLMVLLFSCDEDVNTLADYEDVAIVWAFLDKSDTAHYVVIQKGFVNPNGDARDITQIADSLYFDQLDVQMQEISSSGNINNTYSLKRVNLADEGYEKRSGEFTTAENYAYKFKASLSPNYSYNLIATKGGKTFEASTGILDVDTTSLNVFGLEWRGQDSSLHLTFSDNSGSKQSLFWSPIGADVFDAVLSIKYFDISISNPQDTTTSYVHWKIVDDLRPNSNSVQNVNRYYDQLKNELLSSMPKLENGYRRYLGYMSFKLAGGTKRLVHYLNLKQAQSGISSGQVTPEFTEGFHTPHTYGLFDTRGSAQYYHLTFSPVTIRLLRFDPDFAELGIEGQILK